MSKISRAETLSSFDLPAPNLFHPWNIILCLFMLLLSLPSLSELIPFYRFFPSLSSRNFPRERRTSRKGCLEFIWTGNSFQIFETDGVKTSSIRRPKTPAAELISGSKPWTWLGIICFCQGKIEMRVISDGWRNLSVIKSDSCIINVYILEENSFVDHQCLENNAINKASWHRLLQILNRLNLLYFCILILIKMTGLKKLSFVSI